MTKTQSCGEALVRLLEDYGVELVFGVPGVHTLELYRGLVDSSIRHVLVRHEQGAGFMADGYARATGQPGGWLAGASAVWGMLAGNVIGPGFFLAPFLLGTGMNRMTFVGTLATVTLVMNVLKLSVFGATDLMTTGLFVLGVIVGLTTIPGNWLGRHVLRGMTDRHHRVIVDVLTALMR